MNRSLATLFLVIMMLVAVSPEAGAESVDGQLRAAIRQRFGTRMPYYTLVPYKSTYFASCYDVKADVRNSTGRRTHWGIWEYKGGRWSFIFTFDSTADADEESARLDAIFARNQFSSTMRQKLMYGPERRL